jgi:phage terminase Nu1 subunit (DNA packaging protein)
MTKKPETVSTAYVARIVGLTKRQVQEHASSGVIPKLDHNKYNLEIAVQGYIRWLKDRIPGNRSGSITHSEINDHRARKEKHLADRAELELLRDQKAVLDRDQVERETTELLVLLKTQLRNIPGRVAMQLAGEIPEQEIKRIVLSEVDICLRELAKGVSENQERRK